MNDEEPARGVFVHERGVCESKRVGAGTKVWAFAHVLPEARLGADCNVCDNVFIENDVIVGDRVTIKCGVQLWDGIRIEDDVFIGPNVTFSNDPFPRSKQRPEKFAETIVRAKASIGANATLLPNIEIGSLAMVGAGSVVTRSVPPRAIVMGNPARIVGYVQPDGSRREVHEFAARNSQAPSIEELPVRGVTLHHLPSFEDMRGSLAVGEVEKHLPFPPARFFLVHSVPGARVRGEHAHIECHQFLICTSGACSVLVDDGTENAEVRLDSPSKGLYMPPMTWGVQYKYSEDAVLLVFASHSYDANDYIRSYEDFAQRVRS